MPPNPPNPAAIETLVFASLVLVLAVILGIRQGFAVHHRVPEDHADVRGLAGRDRRRWAVVGLLALIGLAMLGSTTIHPLHDRQAARLWTWIWVGILVSTLVLIGIAMIDWLAAASEARRQVHDLAEEHRALLGEVLRARSRAAEGSPDPPVGHDE